MEKVLEEKLQQFVDDCKQEGIDHVVVKDGAGPHSHLNPPLYLCLFWWHIAETYEGNLRTEQEVMLTKAFTK